MPDQTIEPVRASAEWLALRERADAAARDPELAALAAASTAGTLRRIHDLGCGTGSMARWLAARLPVPQLWFLYDRDAELLDQIDARAPGAADGSPVVVETRRRDITRLEPDDLAGATLITASALLDMMTADEVGRLVAACVRAGCPTLITLTVTGQVELDPPESWDATVGEAFNDHQRRSRPHGSLLGPDAAGVTAEEFTRLGWEVVSAPSPWRLGPGDLALTQAWLAGWVGAACEQRPELSAEAAAYARRRLAQAGAGQLTVTVHHQDLLARPPLGVR